MLMQENQFPQRFEEIFSALGDKSRRRIYWSLMRREQSIKELAAPIGITITALGQHIKILEQADLVTSRKVGRERICSISPAGIADIEGFSKLQREIWKSRFGALRKIVEED